MLDYAMLLAVPKHIFSKTYAIREDEQQVGTLSLSWFSENGEATVDGETFELTREGTFSGAFKLERNGTVIAKAHKPSAFRNRFDVEFAQARITLERVGLVNRAFVVRNQDEEIGRVQPVGALSGKARIDLPEEWPLPLRLFVLWLVLIIWKRMDSA